MGKYFTLKAIFPFICFVMLISGCAGDDGSSTPGNQANSTERDTSAQRRIVESLALAPDNLPESCSLSWIERPLLLEPGDNITASIWKMWFGKSKEVEEADLGLSNVYASMGDNSALVEVIWYFSDVRKADTAAAYLMKKYSDATYYHIRQDGNIVVIISQEPDSVGKLCYEDFLAVFESQIDRL